MSKSVFTALVFTCLLFLLATCDTYEFPKSPYPRVETVAVADITETGVTFQGNIISAGSSPIIDHGFIWGTEEEVLIDNGDKVHLGARSAIGKFNAPVKSGLVEDQKYFVKAFVATADYFVYGEAIPFTSMGGTAPVIARISTQATVGDTVLIEGKHFSSKVSNNEVKFGTVKSIVLASTDTTLRCIVPNNIPNSSPVSVIVSGELTVAPITFIVAPPTISSFTSETGTFEDIVTVLGTNFSWVKAYNTVQFNEHTAEITEVSKTKFKVKVPTAIMARENAIRVAINGQSYVTSTKFIILPPSVSAISTQSDFIGATVQLTGNNFNPSAAGNIVLFEERQATIVEASKTNLKVKVPSGIYKNRTFRIEIRVAEQSAFIENFTLKDTWIRKADLPLSDLPNIGPRRYAATSFAINGMGYAGLGGDGIDNAFFRYDPAENTWSGVAAFPGGKRGYVASFVIDNEGYVGMGTSGDPYLGGGTERSDFWRYNPLTNQWTSIASIPTTVGYVAHSFSLNGKGYVVTLSQDDNFWEYNPSTNQWTALGEIPLTFWHYPNTGFEVNGRVFIVAADSYGAKNQLWEYNFGTNTWVTRTPLPNDTYYGQVYGKGFSINNFGYVKYQDSSGQYLFKYNPATDTWVEYQLTIAPGGLNPIVFVIDNKAYFGTGNNGIGTDIWEYDPDYQ